MIPVVQSHYLRTTTVLSCVIRVKPLGVLWPTCHAVISAFVKEQPPSCTLEKYFWSYKLLISTKFLMSFWKDWWLMSSSPALFYLKLKMLKEREQVRSDISSGCWSPGLHLAASPFLLPLGDRYKDKMITSWGVGEGWASSTSLRNICFTEIKLQVASLKP